MNKIIVFQTDFGLDDGAISAMEGVSYQVSYDLNIRHLTHNIPQYNIFDASYRLYQAIGYWPKGTTFVSVVDPGVGSDRKSVVAKTKNGMYIITPDNGTLTHIAKHIGLEEVRLIEEGSNRLKDSELSYTFMAEMSMPIPGRDWLPKRSLLKISVLRSMSMISSRWSFMAVRGSKTASSATSISWMFVSVPCGHPFLTRSSSTAVSRSVMIF